jgi:hypothetical protein
MAWVDPLQPLLTRLREATGFTGSIHSDAIVILFAHPDARPRLWLEAADQPRGSARNFWWQLRSGDAYLARGRGDDVETVVQGITRAIERQKG